MEIVVDCETSQYAAYAVQRESVIHYIYGSISSTTALNWAANIIRWIEFLVTRVDVAGGNVSKFWLNGLPHNNYISSP